jgi:hypothetical protein
MSDTVSTSALYFPLPIDFSDLVFEEGGGEGDDKRDGEGILWAGLVMLTDGRSVEGPADCLEVLGIDG